MAIVTAGLSVNIFLSSDTPLIIIVGTLVWLGFGYTLFSSPNTNAIISCVEKQYLGIASGMVVTIRSIRQVPSMAIAALYSQYTLEP